MNDESDIRKRILDQQSFAVKQSLANVEELIKVYQAEKTRRKSIEAANEKIRAIVNSMTDGMLATDGDFVIVEANPVATRLAESNRSDLIGQDLASVFNHEVLHRHLEGIRQDKPEQRRFEFTISQPVERTLRWSVSRIQNEQGYVFVIHDISSENRAQNLKNEFLSILSHELRTPLTGIQGYAELLQVRSKDKFTEELESYLDVILHFSRQMFNTVDDLLQFAQIQVAGVDLLTDTIDLLLLLEDIKIERENTAQEKQITLTFETELTSASLTGNYEFLRDAIDHIVLNAIIFGKPNGHVTIRLNETDDHYHIDIVDDGIGIPASEIDKVFNSFYQAEEHMKRNQDGLGLGLSIAKHVIHHHQGDIRIESKLGEGTTCFLTLPKSLSGIVNPQS